MLTLILQMQNGIYLQTIAIVLIRCRAVHCGRINHQSLNILDYIELFQRIDIAIEGLAAEVKIRFYIATYGSGACQCTEISAFENFVQFYLSNLRFYFFQPKIFQQRAYL